MISLKPPQPTGKPHPRTKFTLEEDEKITKLVEKYGENNWNKIASKVKGRNVRQCRERWRNYLSPDIDKSVWKEEEDQLLLEKYKELGPRWKIISSLFPNRTDIAVKNRMHKIVRNMEKKHRKALHLKKDQYQKYKEEQMKLEAAKSESNPPPKVLPIENDKNKEPELEEDLSELFNFNMPDDEMFFFSNPTVLMSDTMEANMELGSFTNVAF